MASDWFVVRKGEELGPYSGPQLKQLAAAGTLRPTDLVRRADMKAPRPAGEVKGLFPAPVAPAASPPALPPPPPAHRPVPPASKPAPVWGHPAALLASLVVCFPVGLVLVWLRPGWSPGKRLAWAGGTLAVWVTLILLIPTQPSGGSGNGPRPSDAAVGSDDRPRDATEPGRVEPPAQTDAAPNPTPPTAPADGVVRQAEVGGVPVLLSDRLIPVMHGLPPHAERAVPPSQRAFVEFVERLSRKAEEEYRETGDNPALRQRVIESTVKESYTVAADKKWNDADGRERYRPLAGWVGQVRLGPTEAVVMFGARSQANNFGNNLPGLGTFDAAPLRYVARRSEPLIEIVLDTKLMSDAALGQLRGLKDGDWVAVDLPDAVWNLAHLVNFDDYRRERVVVHGTLTIRESGDSLYTKPRKSEPTVRKLAGGDERAGKGSAAGATAGPGAGHPRRPEPVVVQGTLTADFLPCVPGNVKRYVEQQNDYRSEKLLHRSEDKYTFLKDNRIDHEWTINVPGQPARTGKGTAKLDTRNGLVEWLGQVTIKVGAKPGDEWPGPGGLSRYKLVRFEKAQANGPGGKPIELERAVIESASADVKGPDGRMEHLTVYVLERGGGIQTVTGYMTVNGVKKTIRVRRLVSSTY